MQPIELLARLPLAEGVFALWRYSLPNQRLEAIYEQHRGRCYQKAFSFAQVVQLLADALCQHGGSGRASYEQAAESTPLPASAQALYGKLRRMPLAVSEALLADCTAPLLELYPAAAQRQLPPCVQEFEVLIVDGKAIKRLAKRLKVVQGRRGGVLGGRALVGVSLRSGLAVAMAAHADGEINDVRLLPQLLQQLRQGPRSPQLYLGDSGYCDLNQPALFCEGGDHFLVRQHPKLHFHPDPQRLAQRGKDDQGRAWVEDWGWIGSPQDKRRRYVRRIRLALAQGELTLLSSLLEAERYPAVAMLELYRQRWGIERVFQQVTEVFGLEGLIGSSPQASVFQFAFCLVLYNLVQVLRGYVAAGNRCATEAVSVEKLFADVERQLIAWSVLGSVAGTTRYFARASSVAGLRHRLSERVGTLWRNRWKKSPPQKRNIRARQPGKDQQHTSVYRILEEHGRKRMRRRHDQ
jgi:hypothetical protein